MTVTVMVKKSPDGVSLLVASPPTPGFGPPVLLLLLLVSESSASDDLSVSNLEKSRNLDLWFLKYIYPLIHFSHEVFVT